MSPRYKITYEYCGKYFTGWQRLTYELDKLPVQNVLENSLKQIFNKEIKVIGSSRTDAGVSALANTSHFDIDERISKKGQSLPLLSTHDLTMAINYNVGDQYKDRIRIIKTEIVDDMFHSRFHATSRTYLYKILANCGKKQTPLELLGKVLEVGNVLDINKMQDAAQVLTGKHDFTSFKSRECTKNPIRTIEYIKVFNLPTPELLKYHPDFIKVSREVHNIDSENTGLQYIGIEIKARSFLHNQVRIMVSSLIEVGKGKLTKSQIQEILDKKDRLAAPQTIAAEPLTLLKVSYDNDKNNNTNNSIYNKIINNIKSLFQKNK